MDLMKSLEFAPLEEEKVVTKENLQELVNNVIDSKVTNNTEVKVIYSNKAINDYNKKINRIKKRDSKPAEADLIRIEQAQKERKIKRAKNLLKAGK